MTRKDFEEIASIIRTFMPHQRKRVAARFGDQLGIRSPRFDRDRFLEACDIPVRTMKPGYVQLLESSPFLMHEDIKSTPNDAVENAVQIVLSAGKGTSK